MLAVAQHRRVQEQGSRADCEGDADRSVARWREAPLQCRSYVSDLPVLGSATVALEKVGANCRQAFREIDRMTSCDRAFRLASGQLQGGVGSCSVHEAIGA